MGGCRGYGMRKGERYRKSVRGCIISHQVSVLHMVIVKKGEAELEGLTDNQIPRRLGPKRASKLRKLFALSKVMGGQDKQGFSMKQGVLTADRVKLMMAKGDQGCRGYGMRKGERYRKSCRGCIISHQIAMLH